MTPSDSMPWKNSLTRRDFLKATGVGATGLVIPFSFSLDSFGASSSKFSPNLFMHIPSEGPIEIICHRSEMGQGIRTSIAQLMADEMDVDLQQIRLVQALGDAKYGDQNTDGSKSIRVNWDRLRKMGAQVRQVMREAAAKKWNVPVAQLRTRDGKVLHSGLKKSISYQKLASLAKSIPLSEKVKPKKPSEWKYIRKPVSGLDVRDYARGAAVFGMDVDVPGMVHVALNRAPIPGGEIKKLDSSAAEKIPGVEKVFKLEGLPQDVNTSNAVAVAASNTWAAFEGCKNLVIDWDLGGLSRPSDAELLAAYKKEMDREEPGKVYLESNPKQMDKPVVRREEFVYQTPFLVHAPMEPLVAVAHVQKAQCRIWAPTQAPQRAQKAVAKFLGMKPEQVEINVTFLGGGFGRKSQPDFVLEAVAASRALGKPAKVVWTREDEVKQGFYHPLALQRIRVGYDKNGRIYSWDQKSVFSSLMKVFAPSPKALADWELFLGATTIPYNFAQVKVSGSHVDVPVRTGWLRAVHNIFHSFSVNTTIDTIAESKKRDPIDFSLEMLGVDRKIRLSKDTYQDIGRLKEVIRKVRKLSDWDKKSRAGASLGFAHHFSFMSYLAFVVELEKSSGKKIPAVKRAYCVIDCGHHVNPDYVRSQMEGSVVFGMSAVYYGMINIDRGQVRQSNFHDYPVLRANEAPPVEVEIVVNNEAPAGVGEPGVPAFIPALTNAISRAQKNRITQLPIKA